MYFFSPVASNSARRHSRGNAVVLGDLMEEGGRAIQPLTYSTSPVARLVTNSVVPIYTAGTSNLGRGRSLMHGVAPRMCDQVARPWLCGEAQVSTSGRAASRPPDQLAPT